MEKREFYKVIKKENGVVIDGKEFNEEQLKDFINMYNYENFEELEEKYKSKQQSYEAIREKWKF